MRKILARFQKLKWLAFLSAIFSAAGASAAPTPPASTSLDARVIAVRKSLAEQAASTQPIADKAPEPEELAQWNNWSNWNNYWHNWRNF